jgi:hypothetical protein
MMWLVLVVALATVVIIAGRSHSKRLDELDELHAQGRLNKSWRRD